MLATVFRSSAKCFCVGMVFASTAFAASAPLLLDWGRIETTSTEHQTQFKALQALPVPSSAQRLSVRGSAPWLVQFDDVIQESWKAELHALGAQLKGYIPENAFIVTATPEQVATISALKHVVWVGEYLPAYKKSQSVRSAFAQGVAESLECTIILFEASDVARIQADLAKLSSVVIGKSGVMGDRGVIRARLPGSVVELVSGWAEVEWIEPYVAPKFVNDVAVWTNKMNATNVWFDLGLTGTGQVIAVCDTGLDTGNTNTLHRDFTGRVAWAQALGRPGNWSDTHSHGTHVSGSVLGSGVSSTGRYKGVAYEARLVFQSVLDSYGGLGGLPYDLNDLFRAAYTNGARIHSDSWGSSVAGEYTVDSQQVDQFVWSNRNMLIVFAASNDGIDDDADGVIDLDSIGAPGTAKNCLTVGAAESYRTSGGLSGYTWGNAWPSDYPANPVKNDYISRPDEPQGMAAFSSRGPCNDGRIKPDIVAPGTDILSARSKATSDTGWGAFSGNTNYIFMGGTSMATPLTSGAAGLVRQWLIQVAGITDPSAALVKALMMNGARNMAPGQYGTGATQEIPDSRPNNVEGWGHVDLYKTLSPSTELTLRLYDTNSLATGESNQFTVAVAAPTTEKFTVTLAYSDYWAASGAGKKLVNDLDLTIIKPLGSVVYANGSTQLDSTNNVETIEFEADEAGTYTIQVHARTVPQGGSQPYSLVLLSPMDATPTAPFFGANPGPVSTTSGVAISFSVRANGYPVPAIELPTATASGGYTFTAVSGLLAYTPPYADIGTQTFTFTASNELGVATQLVSVVVYSPPSNEPPVLVSVGSRSIVNDGTLTFSVTAHDQDFPDYYDTMTLMASNLPAGATFPVTQALGTVVGTFSWPNASPTGSYDVTFHVADRDGSDAESVTVSVIAPYVSSLETFDITENWAGGAAISFGAKYYTNTAALPEGGHFEANSSTRETTYSVSSNAWRIGSDSTPNVYVRYIVYTNITQFAMKLARWDNTPTPNFVVRYSTDSGASYTTLLSTNGSWFTGDKVFKTYESGQVNIMPNGSDPVWIELFRSSGERMLMDDFSLTYRVDGEPGDIGTPPVLDPLAARYVPLGETLQFAVQATPTDGGAVTLTASNLPPGAVFGSTNEVGSFLWVPAQPLGVYTSYFYAEDADGVDVMAATITVVDVSSGGMETFSNLNAPSGSFAGGSYVGDNGIVWFYAGASIAPVSEAIDGTSIGLDESRINPRGFYSDTMSNGVGSLNVKYRKSSLAAGTRSFELYVNTQKVATVSDANNEGVQTQFVAGINIPSNVVVKLVSTGDKAIVVDSLSWTTCGAPENPDSDGDGIADEWENSYFGSLTNVSATSDWDGDRFIDLHEYLAGSNPTNAGSLLLATSTRVAADGAVVVTWQSESNRSYLLARSTNLMSGFTGIASNLPAVYPLNTYTDTLATNVLGNYRVELE